ncbi:response regulator transcription factor [Lysinibacillus sp. NPDC098008]|uniref:response regulator transcription factor n=1 Tax=Lysinibacillus sp. NPDC098008 TaxID=3364146 RepID=UPI003812A9E5
MRNEKILIVEDDIDIMEVLSLTIAKAHYTVLKAISIAQGWHMAMTEQPDLILLDVNLPDGTGFELAKKIRAQSDVIIIFVTVNHFIDQKLEGFEVGADDYITKPFIPKELLARVQANLKRKAGPKKSNIIHIDNLAIHYDEKNVYKDGVLLNLFTKEKLLLFYLIEHANQVISVDQLIDHVWGRDGVADSKTVSVHISTLRRKIEDTPAKPKWIQTMRGFGYQFVHKKKSDGS